MEPEALLRALVELAGELDLPVRGLPASAPEGEPPPRSGSCLLRGRRVVLLSAADPLEHRIGVLVAALRQVEAGRLEGRWLPPAVRARLTPPGASPDADGVG